MWLYELMTRPIRDTDVRKSRVMLHFSRALNESDEVKDSAVSFRAPPRIMPLLSGLFSRSVKSLRDAWLVMRSSVDGMAGCAQLCRTMPVCAWSRGAGDASMAALTSTTLLASAGTSGASGTGALDGCGCHSCGSLWHGVRVRNVFVWMDRSGIKWGSDALWHAFQ